MFPEAQHVGIHTVKPSGPYTVVCGRCKWRRKAQTIGAAILWRRIHVGTLKHTTRHGGHA